MYTYNSLHDVCVYCAEVRTGACVYRMRWRPLSHWYIIVCVQYCVDRNGSVHTLGRSYCATLYTKERQHVRHVDSLHCTCHELVTCCNSLITTRIIIMDGIFLQTYGHQYSRVFSMPCTSTRCPNYMHGGSKGRKP